MAYTDPFEISTPSGGAFLAHGDDRIRELKRALQQRLSTAFVNWPDGDPLLVRSVAVGLLEDRPNPPAAIGILYYATDVKTLFVAKSGPAWEAITGGGGGGGTATGSETDYAFKLLKIVPPAQQILDGDGSIVSWDSPMGGVGRFNETTPTYPLTTLVLPATLSGLLSVAVNMNIEGWGDVIVKLHVESWKGGTVQDSLSSWRQIESSHGDAVTLTAAGILGVSPGTSLRVRMTASDTTLLEGAQIATNVSNRLGSTWSAHKVW